MRTEKADVNPLSGKMVTLLYSSQLLCWYSTMAHSAGYRLDDHSGPRGLVSVPARHFFLWRTGKMNVLL